MKKHIILLVLLTYLFPAFDNAFGQDSRQDKAMTHYNWGNEFSGNSEYELAILEYNGTIGLAPDFYRAYYRRGNAYYMTGENQKAIDDYNTAIKLSPDYAEAYFNRGIVFYNIGSNNKSIDDIKKSIDDWETVLRIEPNNAQAKEYLEMARKLLEQMLRPPVAKAARKPAPAPVAVPPPPALTITIYTHINNNNAAPMEMQTPQTVIKVIPGIPPETKK